ncbi:MAG: phospholipase D-like domain-containing protein [Candidatus Rokubacteria bacterium]|nr:phospholipase D-like domain-containing protein [Candidatus Rokubacteria bacterium]
MPPAEERLTPPAPALPAAAPAEARPALRRLLAEQAFSRASGAPLVGGNRIWLLRDAAQNYPAWLEAIDGASRTIHFESYIVHDDAIGRQFADRLTAKARDGVRVRLIYDWLGALGKTSRRFWRRLRDAGVEVRCFNPPRFESPFGWMARDHRKLLTVDSERSFVTGLCVGRMWVGDPARGVEPWRDTGVELRGPAVADIERAFAETWAHTGAPLDDPLPTRASIPDAGSVMLRVVGSRPGQAELYRLDQLIAAGARRSLWLTDAYFVGGLLYVEALRAAARDGVDVRLLVPGATDIWLVRALSRAGYRPLLEAGIRVFEWRGSMLHAKTAVVDGRWARVGSTNLNVQSWIGNWELDVAVEDEAFAEAMEDMYRDDLEHATEIVLTGRRRVRATAPERPVPRPEGGRGSVGRAAAGAIGIGSAVTAAMTNRRELGPAEATLMAAASLVLLALAAIALLVPWLVVIPAAALSAWLGLALLLRAWRARRGAGPEAPP